jgi:hypothetical protein
MPRRAAVLTLLVTVVAVAASAAPAGAAKKVPRAPRAFFGVMADPLVFGPPVGFERQSAAMRSAGVGSLRYAVYWDEIQPYGTAADVPESDRARFDARLAGRPADLSALDGVVATAARRGIDLLPVVLRAPEWAAASPGDHGSPPRRVSDYARFVGALVARYGTRGSFWRQNPSLPRRPVRRWQVWNEPDITTYWSARPWARTYVKLLRAARKAIRRADPRAKVVLAGLTNRSWLDLRAVYKAGGRGLFDVAAIHPFSGKVRNVVRIARYARREMRRAGDGRTPLLLSEVSWSSGAGQATHTYGWETSERGQASRLRAAATAFVRERVRLRLAGFYWYTWLSPAPGSPESFDYSGLRRLDADGRVVDKPALAAFRSVARRCGR